MKFTADFATCEDGQDKVLSVCQCGPDGDLEHEVIIQRGPKEFDPFDDHPGPKISYDQLGLDAAPGPQAITFTGDVMKIVLADCEDLEVDLSRLSPRERKQLESVAAAIFR